MLGGHRQKQHPGMMPFVHTRTGASRFVRKRTERRIRGRSGVESEAQTEQTVGNDGQNDVRALHDVGEHQHGNGHDHNERKDEDRVADGEVTGVRGQLRVLAELDSSRSATISFSTPHTPFLV